MNIGIVPDPTHSPDWPKIEAFLEPAAKLGGVPVLEPLEEVWTAVEGGDLFAAATARLTNDGLGEVVLVGGRDRKRWLAQLDQQLGRWFKMEGRRAMRAYGRKGWTRELEKLGWSVIGEKGGVTAYEKVL